MRLIKIHISNFGRLSEQQMTFDEGFQLIYGANEKGKSTIMAFVRTMLYGPAGSGKRQINENDRRRYMPWEDNKMGGYIVLENQGARYRLERQFARTKSGDQTALMDDISGRSLELGNEEPGYRLLGLTENEFVNTVFIGQLSSTIGTSEDLLGRLSNLAGSGDSRISHLEVVKRLNQAQVDLKAARGSGGRLNTAYNQIEKLHAEREAAVNEALLQAERLNRLDALKNLINQREEERQRASEMAGWQEKLDFLEKHTQMKQRLRQLESDKVNLCDAENKLKKGDFQATRQFVKQGLALEQDWQNFKAQIRQSRQQVARSRDKINELNAKMQKYGLVLEIEHSEFKKLQQLLKDQRLTVEQRTQELAEIAAEENRRREKNNTENMSRTADEVSAARQMLQSVENDIKTITRDIERLLEQEERIKAEYEKQSDDNQIILSGLSDELQSAAEEKEDSLQQKNEYAARKEEAEVKLAGLKEKLESGLNLQIKSKTKTIMLVTAGMIFILVGAVAGLLVNPLAWVISGFGLLVSGLGLVFGLRFRNIGSIEFTREIQLLESELRIADSKIQSQDQVYRYAERTYAQIELRLAKSKSDDIARQEKYIQRIEDIDKHKNELMQNKAKLEEQQLLVKESLKDAEEEARLLRENIEKQKPVNLLDEDVQLRQSRQVLSEYMNQLQELTSKAGCDSPEQLSSLLQEVDNLRSQVNIFTEELRHDENDLKERDEEGHKAGAELIAWLKSFIEIRDPQEAVGVLEQLSIQVEEMEIIKADVSQLEQAFTDRLENQTWDEWQAKATHIEKQMHEAIPPPERLEKSARENLEKKLAELQNDLMSIREERAALESEISHFSQRARNVSDIDDQIADVKSRISSMENYYQILEQAKTALDEAADDMQSSFGPALNQAAAQNLARLTGSRYDDLKVDKSFDVKVSDPATAKFREWQYLSGGTVDQVYLALRLAISDQISNEDNRLPLLLDDILIQYDEERAKAALEWLISKSREENQQMLLFSCQERMVHKAKAEGLPVHIISG